MYGDITGYTGTKKGPDNVLENGSYYFGIGFIEKVYTDHQIPGRVILPTIQPNS